MRNLKRVLSLALALVMVLGMMVITTSAADFTDADQIEQTEAVEVLAALGIVQGSNGAFNPKGTFTREAAAKLITYMKLGPTMAEKLAGTDVFSDVAADRWSAKYIGYCANLGYITGVGDGKFNPDGVLKDIELGKLVLCAIGKDPAKYTGANWASAVTIDMLDAGLVANVTGTAISREDACAMILAAMKYSETPTKYQIVEIADHDEVIGEFDTVLDATLYCKVIDAAGTTYEVIPAPAKDTLLSKVYKVTYSPADVDAYGRPAVSYKNFLPGAANVTLIFADAPAMTYTNGFNAGTVTALTKAGYTLADNIVVNGVVADAGFDTVAELAGRNYVGTVIELYNTDTNAKTIEKIVMVETYLAKVKDVKSDDKVATNNFVELEVYNPYDSDDVATIKYYETGLAVPCTYDALVAKVAKNDMLLVQYQGADTDTPKALLAFEAATSVKGTLTATTLGASYRGTIVVGGETYTMASAYAEKAGIGGALTLGEEYTLYFDANGYVIGAAPKQAAKAQVAVMTQIVKVTNNTNGSIGAAGDTYMEAELVYFDGSKEVVKVASFTGTSGTTYEVADWFADIPAYFNNTVVKYTVNAKGEYVLVGQNATVTASGATLADSVTFDGTNLANNNTKFIIRTGAGNKQDPYKYAAYTGYANLPVKTLNTGATVTGIKYAQGATNVAEYVYITATVKTTSNDGKTVAFVTGAPTNIYVDAFTNYFQYPVIINGEVTTLNVADDSTVSAGKLWRVDTLDADGYVTAATDLSGNATSIAVAAKDGIVKIGTDWKTYSSDTVVYLIDPVAGTASTADITTLNADNGVAVGDVYVTYVQLPNNGGNSAAIALIIAIEA